LSSERNGVLLDVQPKRTFYGIPKNFFIKQLEIKESEFQEEKKAFSLQQETTPKKGSWSLLGSLLAAFALFAFFFLLLPRKKQCHDHDFM
jgi:hypothetical protein